MPANLAELMTLPPKVPMEEVYSAELQEGQDTIQTALNEYRGKPRGGGVNGHLPFPT